MALTTIVSGIDPSPLAHNALRWSSDLAERTNAALRVVGAWQMPLIGLLPLDIEGLPTPEYMATKCRAMMTTAVTETETTPDESSCVEGPPGPSLVAAAHGADLLVVGRTGQGRRRGAARLAEVLLGSTARHCVHHSDVAVAAVPADAQWPKADPVAVIGVDGSPNSLYALEWALSSLPDDTKLHVIRGFAPWVGDGLTPLDLVHDTAFISAFETETSDWVDAAVERVGSRLIQNPDVHVMIASGINAVLGSDLDPDLIIVGQRGHTGIAAKVLGSVADHVVRHAPCPVVVVPVPAAT